MMSRFAGFGLGLAVMTAMAAPAPTRAALSGSVTLTAAVDANVISWTGSTEAASSEPRTLADRDTIVTESHGRALVSAAAWSAVLDGDTRASLKTETIQDSSGPAFARMLDLAQGSLTWTVTGSSPAWLRTPAGLLKAAPASKVHLSWINGQMQIETDEGVTELTGASARLTTKTGQRFLFTYAETAGRFHVEMLEDNGKAVDLEIGKTTIHVTKGDVLDATVLGEHLDVRVSKGVVQVTGPDKRTAEVGPGKTETVVGGGKGSVSGNATIGPVAPKDKQMPPEPRPAPYRDRTDVWPSTDVSPS